MSRRTSWNPRVAAIALVAVLAVVGVAQLPPGAVSAGEPAAPSFDPIPSEGCGSSQATPVVEEQRFIDVNGTERWFLLTVPGAHDGNSPLPIVVDFHGLAEGAQIHTLMSEFSGIAEREGFVVVFPHGRFDPVRWDANPNSDPNQDLEFVETILDTLGSELCLDRTRVYAAGLSYGAFMTSLVTCKLSDRFAAVAPVAGIVLTDPCPQARDVPIVTFHGTDDGIILFNGGFGQLPFGTGGSSGAQPQAVDLDGAGIPANVRGWAARNGCDPQATDTPLTSEVLHRVYDCPPGADVEFYIVLGGGHTWPGSQFSKAIEGVVGYTTFDIHASEVAWQFFRQFQVCPEGETCVDSSASDPDPPSSTPTDPATSSPTDSPQASTPTPASTQAVSPSFTG
jgi:polyhydroxybutyrate depolymerase